MQLNDIQCFVENCHFIVNRNGRMMKNKQTSEDYLSYKYNENNDNFEIIKYSNGVLEFFFEKDNNMIQLFKSRGRDKHFYQTENEIYLDSFNESVKNLITQIQLNQQFLEAA